MVLLLEVPASSANLPTRMPVLDGVDSVLLIVLRDLSLPYPQVSEASQAQSCGELELSQRLASASRPRARTRRPKNLAATH